jgi:putative PIN family toxin of toxin-antitoxin system
VLKVVYDTNVVVSGLLSSRGIPALLLDLVFNKRVTLILSEEIFNEYVEVLGRPKFNLPKRQRNSVLRQLRKLADWVAPDQRISVAKDPDDNIILECAVAGRSDYLVTGNLRHFPKSISQIPILNPRQFLDIYLRSIAEDGI